MNLTMTLIRTRPALITFAFLAAPAATAQTYRLRELPPLTGHPFSAAWGINDAGVAVGQSGIADDVTVAVRWIDGVPESLGMLPGYSSSLAMDVSANGERVACFGYIPNGPFALGLGLPCVWEAGVMSALPLPPDIAYGEVMQIKETGETIVGAAYNFDGSMSDAVACRWDWDGAWNVTVLPTLGGPGPAYAGDINAAGTIFGYTSNSLGVYRACRWDPGATEPTDLGAPDYSFVGGGNDYSECVGATASEHGLLWLPEPAYDRPQGPSDLGTLPGFTRCWLNYINNDGIITGVAWNSGQNPYEALHNTRGFIWRNGSMHSANTLIPAQPAWNIRKLWDINETSQIVGLGVRNGLSRGVILSVCVGDVDGNHTVNLGDLTALLGHFGSSEATHAEGDLDGDALVNLGDLTLMLSNFGSACN